MVTTDWWTHGEHYRETKAGNDIKMANGYEERVQEAFEKDTSPATKSLFVQNES